MDCSPPGSSVHGILQARILEWVTIPFSRGYSWPGDQTQVSCIAGGVFTIRKWTLLLLSHVPLFATPWTTAQASLSFTVSRSLLRFRPLSRWCYLTISFSAALFSFCLQSFPASGPFPGWIARIKKQCMLHLELQRPKHCYFLKHLKEVMPRMHFESLLILSTILYVPLNHSAVTYSLVTAEWTSTKSKCTHLKVNQLEGSVSQHVTFQDPPTEACR